MVILPRGDIRPVAREADGWIDVIWGGVRAQVLDDVVRVAEGRFAQPLQGAWRVAHGWVFLTADGVVAESETFLGPLRRVGDLPLARVDTGWEQSRRVAIVARNGSVWSADGRGLARVRGLGAAAAREAYFFDERRGAVRLDGDLVVITRDGGARWEVLAPERRGPQHRSDMYRAALSLGVETESRDGRRTRHGPERVALQERQREVIALRLVQQEPAWSDALQSVLFGAHGLAVSGPAGRVVVDLRTGREVEALPHVLHDERLVEIVDPRTQIFVDPHRPVELAELTDTLRVNSWEVTLSRPVRALLATWGRQGVVSLSPQGLGVVRLESPPPNAPAEHTPAEVRTLFEEGDFVEAGVNPDGYLTALRRAETPPSTHYVVGRLDGPLALRALPPGAEHVAFADASRGLVWSASPLRIRRTRDGGATWEELPLGIDGDFVDHRPAAPDSQRYHPPEEAPLPLGAHPERCTRDRCVVGAIAVVRGWDAVSAPARPDLATRAWAGDATPADPCAGQWCIASRMRRFRCEDVGSATTMSALVPALPPEIAGALASGAHPPGTSITNTLAFTPDGAVRAVLWKARGVTQASVAWRGTDARGTYEARSNWGVVTFPGRFSRAFDDREPMVVPLRVTREAVDVHVALDRFVAMWMLRMTPDSTDVQVRSVASPTSRAGDWNRAAGFAAVGGVGFINDASRVHTYDLRAPHAATEAWTANFGSDEEERVVSAYALVERGTRVSVAVMRPVGPRELVEYPVAPDAREPPTAIPWRDDSPLAPCTDAPRPDAPRLSLVAGIFEPTPRWVIESDSRTASEQLTLEARDGGFCLRAVQRFDDGEVYRLRAQPDGSLAGARETERASQPVRCVAR